jgi:hypothetical protein
LNQSLAKIAVCCSGWRPIMPSARGRSAAGIGAGRLRAARRSRPGVVSTRWIEDRAARADRRGAAAADQQAAGPGRAARTGGRARCRCAAAAVTALAITRRAGLAVWAAGGLRAALGAALLSCCSHVRAGAVARRVPRARRRAARAGGAGDAGRAARRVLGGLAGPGAMVALAVSPAPATRGSRAGGRGGAASADTLISRRAVVARLQAVATFR